MKKNAYTLLELLSVIVILSIILVVAYPKVIDIIGVAKINAYITAKKNIVQSAKIKYLADVNSSKVVEYTVDDLISEGYLKKDIKNPLTSESYKNTKVVITNEDNKINYSYIEGDTLYDQINKLNDKDGVYIKNNNLLFKGINANNYISFNGEIYRLLKIDEFRNVYLIKNELSETINKDNIKSYVESYYNDNYSEIIKENILSCETLSYNDYLNSFTKNESFITINKDVFFKIDKDYKVLSYINEELIDKQNASVVLVLKIKNSITIQSGDGTQINPYIIK